MRRDEVLDTAKGYVMVDRAADHGDAENTFPKIAGLWSAYLGIPVTAVDVANMMVLLKIARARGNPRHTDNYVDAAGYAACAAELVEWGVQEELPLTGVVTIPWGAPDDHPIRKSDIDAQYQ